MPLQVRKHAGPKSSSGFELEQPSLPPLLHTELSETQPEHDLIIDRAVEEELDSDAIDSDAEDADAVRNFLQQRKAFHKSQGRAKSKRSDWSQSLVDREFQQWERYVSSKII
jgi:hypothetical protein